MGGKRRKNQRELAFMSEERSEALILGRGGTETSVACSGTEPPASTVRLMEEVCERENLRKAYRKSNKGSPGVDGMTVDALAGYLTEHWPAIREQVLRGDYRPQPVKRVEIGKPDGGVRKLGIPTVLDRFIQQAVQQVPHCDHSIHAGDNALMENSSMRYHHGLKQVGAVVTLMLDMFPNPEKILVAGSSAGGYGAYLGWALVKSLFMNVDTYIMNDSGTGFWNPDDPESWELIKELWNVRIPEECVKCRGTIQTYVYELYLEYDPQLRIGLFSSYRDWLISTWFLGMDQDRFVETLLDVTGEIHSEYPSRFKCFFVQGDTYTTYEFLLPGGPHRAILGTTLYDCIGQLVNDVPAWADLLE